MTLIKFSAIFYTGLTLWNFFYYQISHKTCLLLISTRLLGFIVTLIKFYLSPSVECVYNETIVKRQCVAS